MKEKILNTFIVIFTFLSFLFFMYPTFKMSALGYLIESSKKEEIVSLEEIEDNIRDQPLDIQSPSLTEMLESKTQVRYKIGNLIIPSVNLSVDILAGVNKDSLNYGAASVFIDRHPEKENIPLLGHHFYDEGLLFGPLLKTKAGQSVYMNYQGKEYQYKIREINSINQTQIEVLENTNEPQLTLITCDSPLYTDKRVVVFCDLENIKEEQTRNEAKSTSQNKIKIQNNERVKYSLFFKHFGKTLAICILFLLAIALVVYRLKKKESK